uniref:Recombinase n=1 Tax=Volvox carteri f. nagariensis TaxID=3068 RepID=Q8L752_VOLCA|nr:recombinase [Volvox carteri f. nagariensis]
MDHLWSGFQASTTSLTRLLLLRDLLCCQFMWHTSYRGHDTGKLRLRDFRDPRGGGPFRGFPLPLPDPFGAYPSLSLRIEQLGTKTSKGRRAPPLELRPDPSPRHCFLRTLALYWQLCHAPDAPPGSAISDYLFRPTDRGHQRFVERPFSSSALAMRVGKHLEEAGVYVGQTPHGFRRGTIQATQAAGASRAELHAFSQIRSAQVLERYTDASRPTRVPRGSGPRS